MAIKFIMPKSKTTTYNMKHKLILEHFEQQTFISLFEISSTFT